MYTCMLEPFILCRYETTNHLWLILEYCVGGDLMSLLRQDVRLPESSIHDFGRDMVVALQVRRQLARCAGGENNKSLYSMGWLWRVWESQLGSEGSRTRRSRRHAVCRAAT